MKRLIGLALVIGLVGGYVGSTSALAGKARLKASQTKFFLRDSDACSGPGYLSKKDGPDSGCWQLDSALNEAVIDQAQLLDRDLIADHFDARDGVPFVLNAKKAITGVIATYSGSCYDPAVPCAPAGVGAGVAEVDIIVRGTVGGSEKVLGEQHASFPVVPGGPTETPVNIELDDALNKKKVSSFRVTVFFSGAAAFHSGVELDNPASFVTVPTYVKKK